MGINNTEGPYNEKLRALHNHNVQIKQRYYYYNSFRRCCVFLRVLCFALFNQIVQILITKLQFLRQGKGDPISKDIFFVLNSHSYFFCVSNVFVFIIWLCFFIAANKTHSKKQFESNEEDITLQNLAGGKFINARKKDVKCTTTPS